MASCYSGSEVFREELGRQNTILIHSTISNSSISGFLNVKKTARFFGLQRNKRRSMNPYTFKHLLKVLVG